MRTRNPHPEGVEQKKLSDSEDIRMTMAALFAALVRSLEETAPGLSERFCGHLHQAHESMKGHDIEPAGTLEALKWTDELVRVPRG